MRLILKVGVEKEIPCKENKLVKTWFLSRDPFSLLCFTWRRENYIYNG